MIDNLFNQGGILANLMTLAINFSEVFLNINFNKLMTLAIFILAVTWWIMKIYQQYIETRKFKRKTREEREEKEKK